MNTQIPLIHPDILDFHWKRILCFPKDKKAMLSFSTGATQTMFQPDGVNGDINVTLWPLQVHTHVEQQPAGG